MLEPGSSDLAVPGGGGVVRTAAAAALARQDLLTARAEQLGRGSRAEATWKTYDATTETRA